MIELLVGLVIFALVAYLLWWLINRINPPEPVKTIILVIFVLICALALLNYLPIGLPHGRYF